MKTSVLRWDAGQVTLTEREEAGWQTAQIDTFGGGGTVPMLYHAPYGMMGRPLDPGEDAACQALYAYEGDQGHVFPTLDLRALEKLPALKKGGSIQYDSSGKFGVFDPETRTYTLFVPIVFDDEGNPTKSHALTVGRASDETGLVSLVHANGMGLLMQDDGNNSVILKNSSAPGATSASIILDDSGQIVLSGLVRLASGLAAGSPAAVALARAPEIIAWAGLVTAALNALILKVNALPPVSTIPPVLPLSPSVASTLAKSD